MKRYLLLIAVLITVLNSSAQQAPLLITKLTGDFYIYTTYKTINGQPFPSNSMYLVTHDGVVLFDTPWDTMQFQPLLDSIQNKHNKPVVMCISTHFHDDRTAGLEYFKSKGISTWSSQMTYDLCRKENNPQAQYYFVNDTTFTVGDYTFQTFYPGEGHAPDNIVIWFEKEKILYGGCFVKSLENSSLGNVADANIPAWEESTRRTIKKFRKPTYVIPGHFGWQSNKALKHTLKLIKSIRC